MFLDVHLMIEHPGNFIPIFASNGANSITFHVEALSEARQLLEHIRLLGIQAGISINPPTPAKTIYDVLPYCDLVLVMTVNPGYGGQALIPQCLDKIQDIAAFRKKNGLQFRISADGGIYKSNARTVLEAGADILVIGSAFFRSADKTALVRNVKSLKQ